MPEDRVNVMAGRFFPGIYWKHVKKGDRYSTAVHFPHPLKSVPRVVMGFDALDMSSHGAALRLRLYPQNIMKETFICNQETWDETYLYGCGATWAAIDESGWQTGVFNTSPDSNRSLSNNRVTFGTPFTSPPMVFICFSGLDMTNRWDLRVLATGVDHLGFSILVLTPGAKVGVASLSWIAIPGDDILKRRNAWIGRFSTETGKPLAGGGWSGDIKFGFDFKRVPKIFLGVDELSIDTGRTARLVVSTSNVSKSGMDWSIKTYCDTILHGAGANFLALDCT